MITGEVPSYEEALQALADSEAKKESSEKRTEAGERTGEEEIGSGHLIVGNVCNQWGTGDTTMDSTVP
eukprot:Em0007g244a